MNPFRAKRIADYFSDVGSIVITNTTRGVTVTFRGNRVYFEHENQLWAFLFHIAHAEHQEHLIAEAEQQLAA